MKCASNRVHGSDIALLFSYLNLYCTVSIQYSIQTFMQVWSIGCGFAQVWLCRLLFQPTYFLIPGQTSGTEPVCT